MQAPPVLENEAWRLNRLRQLGVLDTEAEAVLDAFTDSDLGLGGTNVQGFTLGLNMALYRNTTFGVRYLSARTIDTPLNGAAGANASFKANSLQVDLNVRF